MTAVAAGPGDTAGRGDPRRGAAAELDRLWPIAAAFAAFVLAWKLVVVVGGLPVFILPAPEQVAGRFLTAGTDGTIPPHAWTTVVEVALGFAVGAGTRARLRERAPLPAAIDLQLHQRPRGWNPPTV